MSCHRLQSCRGAQLPSSARCLIPSSAACSADTNAATLYDNVYLFFPSAFAHISFDYSEGNDGLLDIRFAASRDGRTARYVPAANGRSSWIPLGINRCQQMTPGSDPAGLQWCDRTPQLATTSHDQSAMYLLRQILLLIPSPFRFFTDFLDGAGI